MKNNRIILIVLAAFIVLAGIFFLAKQGKNKNDSAAPNITAPPISVTNANPTSSVTSAPLRTENIIVYSPQQNSQIANPVTIQGEARTFENTVNVRLSQDDGLVLIEEFTTADAKDIGQFGTFEMRLAYPLPTQQSGKIEVFQYSAKDGSEIDKVVIPVRFPANEQLTVNVYFTSERDSQECETVTAVQRRIPHTKQTARAALDQLLIGPTASEQQNGLRTNINKGVRIQKLTIENGVARVDFDDALQKEVAGSCKVLAIRAQITQTLLQFDTINSVVISINGRTEDILQP